MSYKQSLIPTPLLELGGEMSTPGDLHLWLPLSVWGVLDKSNWGTSSPSPLIIIVKLLLLIIRGIMAMNHIEFSVANMKGQYNRLPLREWHWVHARAKLEWRFTRIQFGWGGASFSMPHSCEVVLRHPRFQALSWPSCMLQKTTASRITPGAWG